MNNTEYSNYQKTGKADKPYSYLKLRQAEQEIYNTVEGLFDTSNNKFYPQHSVTIKFLQYCKLSRQTSENA